MTDLKTCNLKTESGMLRSTFIDYILSLNSDVTDNKYMIIAVFDDNTLASLDIYKGGAK